MNENIYINFSAETSSKDAWAIEFLNSLTITLGKVCDNPMKIHSGNEKDVNSEKLINNANIVLLVFNGFVSDDFSRDMNIIELHQNEYIAEGKEIFVVNKAAKFSSIIPVFLKKFSHYDFFETNTRTNETVEYTPLLKGEKEVKFWSKLTDLVYDIKIFTESRGSIKGDSSRLSVFLAEVSRDQNSNREILRREFLLSDYGVFPIKPLVASYNEFHSSVADILRECDFSIHVMGEVYGDSPSGSDYSFPEIQNKVVTELWKQQNLKESFYRFVWLPPNLEPYDDKQIQYLKRLKRELTDNNYGEIIQCSIEEFKDLVFRKIAQLGVNTQQRKNDDETGTIILITDNAHKDVCKKVEKRIRITGKHCEMVDLSQNVEFFSLNTFKQALQLASGAIIVNVNSDANWMQGVMGLTIKNLWTGDNQGRKSVAAISSEKSSFAIDFESLYVDFFSIDDSRLDQNVDKFLSQIN